MPKPRKRKILLVDDELLIRRVLIRFLKREGYDVFEADSEKMAMEVYKCHRPFDALICDIHLNGDNGWDVIERVRFWQPLLPVAVISGDSHVEGAREDMEFFVLYKPFTPDGLRAVVDSLWAPAKE